MERLANEFGFLFNIFLADSFLKILSFCMDKIDSNETQMNMLNYFYYINHPNFIFPGLFVPFNNFLQNRRSFTKSSLLNIIPSFLMNSLVVEFFARFTNIFTIFDTIEHSIKHFSTFTLVR